MSNNKVLFTVKRVTDFSCPSGKMASFMWDKDTKGFGLKASAGGSKQYILETRLLTGKSIRLTIGTVSSWSIDEARAEARRLQVLIDQGIDPRELARQKAEIQASAEVAKREEELRKLHTLQALCDAYADHLKSKGKLKSAVDVRSAFRVHVLEAHPEVARLPARDVTSHQIANIIRKVREMGKERTAGILRNYLVAAFNAARRAPFDSGVSDKLIGFEISSNPAEIVPAIPVKRGERTLSRKEVQAYIEALTEDEAGLALKVALLTGGQRMAQLLRVKVSDYDVTEAIIRLLDGKGKRTAAREHLIPLGPIAKKIIELLITRRTDSNEKVFACSERMVGNRVSEISVAMNTQSFDLRDIRRTCETMLAKMGVSKDLRAQLLSHGLSGVQDAHYDRHDYLDEKRKALLAWEAHLTKIHPIRTGDETIQPKMSDLFKEKLSKR